VPSEENGHGSRCCARRAAPSSNGGIYPESFAWGAQKRRNLRTNPSIMRKNNAWILGLCKLLARCARTSLFSDQTDGLPLEALVVDAMASPLGLKLSPVERSCRWNQYTFWSHYRLSDPSKLSRSECNLDDFGNLTGCACSGAFFPLARADPRKEDAGSPRAEENLSPAHTQGVGGEFGEPGFSDVDKPSHNKANPKKPPRRLGGWSIFGSSIHLCRTRKFIFGPLKIFEES
jgi:hypothetical protein